MAIVVLVWVACAALGYVVGNNKGRGAEGLLLGLLLGLIGLIIVVFLKPKNVPAATTYGPPGSGRSWSVRLADLSSWIEPLGCPVRAFPASTGGLDSRPLRALRRPLVGRTVVHCTRVPSRYDLCRPCFDVKRHSVRAEARQRRASLAATMTSHPCFTMLSSSRAGGC